MFVAMFSVVEVFVDYGVYVFQVCFYLCPVHGVVIFC